MVFHSSKVCYTHSCHSLNIFGVGPHSKWGFVDQKFLEAHGTKQHSDVWTSLSVFPMSRCQNVLSYCQVIGDYLALNACTCRWMRGECILLACRMLRPPQTWVYFSPQKFTHLQSGFNADAHWTYFNFYVILEFLSIRYHMTTTYHYIHDMKQYSHQTAFYATLNW